MPANIHALPVTGGPAYIRPAEIILTARDNLYRVRVSVPGGTSQELTAHLAAALPRPLKTGDKILLAGESNACGYIIGMLDPISTRAIHTPDGTGACIRGQGEEQSIVVHDRTGNPLFECFSGTGRSVVSVPQGDLQLRAPDGNIELQAGKGIHCTGAEEISIAACKRVRISAKGQARLPDQSLQMDTDGARLAVHRIDVAAGQGHVRIAQATYLGKQVTSSVDRAKLSYGRLEIAAQRILQRSGHLFHQVKHLCQMQAGRLRTLVTGAHHIQSKRTTLIAEDDVRIDGKKINLG